MTTERLILGVMSGSSLDGLDLAMCRFSGKEKDIQWELLRSECVALTTAWKQRLSKLPGATAMELAQTDYDFARFIGEKCTKFLGSQQVDLIASHGHTIFHFPKRGSTCQIGNGAVISSITGFPVACDFRSGDVALGGQGAPITSGFDLFLLSQYDVIINLGGIANMTINDPHKPIAYDICPCNQMLDHFAGQLGKNYDEEGNIASVGIMNEALLKDLMNIDYLNSPFPKTLDNTEVKTLFLPVFDRYEISIPDKMRTAVEFIVQNIKNNLYGSALYKEGKQLNALISGGGVHNSFLMDQLIKETPDVRWDIPDKAFIDYKEAIMIAYMGYLRLNNVPNVFAAFTGASRDTVNGAIYKV